MTDNVCMSSSRALLMIVRIEVAEQRYKQIQPFSYLEGVGWLLSSGRTRDGLDGAAV